MPRIASTNLDVYPLCLGTNTFGWTSSAEESFAVLDEYADAGGNFLDTADVYSAWAPGNSGGESETIIGSWWSRGGKRDQIVLATKTGKLSPHEGQSAKAVRAAVEDSLRRLQTDRIDLLYAHAEDPDNPTDPEIFEQLRRDGKILHYGLSNHSPRAIRDVILRAQEAGVPKPVALQPHYNLLEREEYEANLRPIAEEFDLAVFPYFSLAAGLLVGKYSPEVAPSGQRAGMVSEYIRPGTWEILEATQSIAAEHNVEPAAVAIAWLLAQPTVTAPIASARIPDQLPPLLEGVSIVMSQEELAELDRLSSLRTN